MLIFTVHAGFLPGLIPKRHDFNFVQRYAIAAKLLRFFVFY